MAEANEASTSQVREVPEGCKVLTEGKASILQQGNEVFYNPAQVINRDMSIAVLRQFIKVRQADIDGGKLKVRRVSKPGGPKCLDPEALAERAADTTGIRILEGLAASGLRSIRYALEVEGVSRVDANDLDDSAVTSMRRNIEYNGPEAAAKVHPNQADARVVMIQRAGVYDAVDLDPYGTPAQLLDSAVQAVSEGGLLLVTATDMAVLCGNNGEACWAKYGSYPLHRAYCHEMALRILLASLQSHAARHKRMIVPLLSLSVDFYVRVFVRVYTSPKDVKDAATKLAYVYQSSGCESFYTQRVGRKQMKGNSLKYVPGQGPTVPQQCPQTGSGFLVGGPFWAEPLHDMDFAKRLLLSIEEKKDAYPAFAKIRSILTAVVEELPDVMLYYSLHDLSKTCRTTPPPADTFRSALVNAGYRVSSTHANPLGIKTDAPPDVVWDVMRAWTALHPGKGHEPNSYQAKLVAQPSTIKVDFSRAKGAVSAAKTGRVARFLPNPEANWGPQRKHGRVALGANGTAEEAGKRGKKQKVEGQPEAAQQNDSAVEGRENEAAQQDDPAIEVQENGVTEDQAPSVKTH